MTATDVLVRDPLAVDETRWRELWAGYCRFYETAVADEITAATWARMLDPASGIHGRLAERGGAVIGFAVYVLHEATWSPAPACYLEDLYVDPATRRTGAGRALIQDLIDQGRQRGWSKLYWHTRTGNDTARALYDSFGAADDFVRYRLPLTY
jgi:GNAT superfamily N-acetyltransferase